MMLLDFCLKLLLPLLNDRQLSLLVSRCYKELRGRGYTWLENRRLCRLLSGVGMFSSCRK